METGFASARLRTAEATSLLRILVKSLTRTTLILDALDECHPADRSKIIETLSDMIKVESRLKIMISSRRDDDIKRQLIKEANVGIEAQDNEQDIRTFVEQRVEEDSKRRQRLSMRQLSPQLVEKLIDTLFERSQGMFQWTTLQTAQLLHLEREKDIQERLGKLPKDLEQAYDEIMTKIKAQEGSKPEIAFRAFNWMLTGEESVQFQIDVVVAAVCTNPDEDEITPVDIDADYILDSCQNLVSIDEHGFFYFSHLSVQEYLEQHVCTIRGKNEMALNICLLHILSREDNNLERAPTITRFACGNWYRYTNALEKDLISSDRAMVLLGRFFGVPKAPSKAYQLWLRDVWPSWLGQWTIEESFKTFPPNHPEFVACYFGVSAIMERWIHMKYLDVNQCNDNGNPLLNFAIARDQYSTVDLLLEHGADVNAGGRPLWAASVFALEKSNFKYLELLLNKGADVDMSTEPKSFTVWSPSRGVVFWANTLLATAVGRENIEVMRLLLAHGADVNSVCIQLPTSGHSRRIRRYFNSLELALVRRRAKAAKILLLNGADAFRPWEGKMHTNALILASRMNDAELVKILINKGADVNETKGAPGARDSPLLVAARAGLTESMNILRLLISHGARFNEGFAPGSTIIAMCEEGRTEVVSLMLDEGEDIDVVFDLKTPLIAAICSSNYQVAQMLIERGADMNKNIDGFIWGNALCVAVHIASHKRKYDIVQLLLDKGADVGSRGELNSTPLAIASRRPQNHDLMMLLLDAGADVNQQFDGEFNTVLEGVLQLFLAEYSPKIGGVLYSFLNDFYSFDDGRLSLLDSSLTLLLNNGAVIDDAVDGLLADVMALCHGVIFDDVTDTYRHGMR